MAKYYFHIHESLLLKIIPTLSKEDKFLTAQGSRNQYNVKRRYDKACFKMSNQNNSSATVLMQSFRYSAITPFMSEWNFLSHKAQIVIFRDCFFLSLSDYPHEGDII